MWGCWQQPGTSKRPSLPGRSCARAVPELPASQTCPGQGLAMCTGHTDCAAQLPGAAWHQQQPRGSSSAESGRGMAQIRLLQEAFNKPPSTPQNESCQVPLAGTIRVTARESRSCAVHMDVAQDAANLSLPAMLHRGRCRRLQGLQRTLNLPGRQGWDQGGKHSTAASAPRHTTAGHNKVQPGKAQAQHGKAQVSQAPVTPCMRGRPFRLPAGQGQV